MSYLSAVTCHMSLTPTATDADPTPSNYPTLHRRMVQKDPKINFFHVAKTISETKIKVIRPNTQKVLLHITTYEKTWTLQVIDWIGIRANSVKTFSRKALIQKYQSELTHSKLDKVILLVTNHSRARKIISFWTTTSHCPDLGNKHAISKSVFIKDELNKGEIL